MKLARNWREKKSALTLLQPPAGEERPSIHSRHSKKYNTCFQWPSHLARSAKRAWTGRFSNTGCVWQEWWAVALVMDLDSHGVILLGARNMDEQDSSRARSTAPNRPFRISCKTTKARFPALLTPLAKLAAAKLLRKSALLLLAQIAGLA